MKVLVAAFMLALLFSALVTIVHFGTVQAATMWTQTYGAIDLEEAYSLVETSDGGYAMAGYTESFGAGGRDFWLVKTDAAGDMEWNQTYGGTQYEEAYSLVETSDGGYAMAGYTESFAVGDRLRDFWLVKVNETGYMEWNQTYGGAEDDVAHFLVATSDGGYALIGFTDGASGTDAWLVKTDAAGDMEWNQTYGGADVDKAYSVVETSDGGYAMVGLTGLPDTDFDFWLIKTGVSGNMEWNQTYGGKTWDGAYSLVETSDGGYALAGYTNSSIDMNPRDAWLVKTDASGNMQWNQTYGGIMDDSASSLVVTSDGGYALAGPTESFGAGGYDFWLVKTDAAGDIEWHRTHGEASWDVAYSLVVTSDGGYALAGYAGGDFWLVKTDEFGVVPEAVWVVFPMLAIATVLIFISKKKLIRRCSKEN